MDFLRILQSLEELLYEVMTWLLFYPRTMIRAVRHPIAMLRYSDREQGDAPDQQYLEMLSPPLFLMVTILLSHMVELASHQVLPKPTTTMGEQIVASEQNLLILRSMLFAIYPLMFASARLRREHKPITRDTLRPPFYAQCYVAAPAAFALGIATIMGRAHDVSVQVAGLCLSMASAGWYLWVESVWFRRHLRLSRRDAAWLAFFTWFKASLINGIISWAVLGVSAD